MFLVCYFLFGFSLLLFNLINSLAADIRNQTQLLPQCNAAAAVKSLQSCPTLSDPMDCSLPGSSVHGIVQARVLEWVAIAFCTSAKTPYQNQQGLQPRRRAPPTAQMEGPTGQKSLILQVNAPCVPFLSPQIADSSAWWTGAVPAPGEWRSSTRAPGAPSVVTAETWTMPAWYADSRAVEKPSTPLSLLTLGWDQGPFGWTM